MQTLIMMGICKHQIHSRITVPSHRLHATYIHVGTIHYNSSQVTLTLFPVRVVPVMSSLLMLRLKSAGTPVRAHRWIGVGRMHSCSGKEIVR